MYHSQDYNNTRTVDIPDETTEICCVPQRQRGGAGQQTPLPDWSFEQLACLTVFVLGSVMAKVMI